MAAAKANHDIVLDSETLDSLHDPHITRLPKDERIRALRFGLAVTHDEMFGWRTWTPSLTNLLWEHLTMPGLRIVGWDILSYDLPVICHTVHCDLENETLDLSAEIEAATGRHYRLDTVARANIHRGKIQDTYMVIDWLRHGDPASMTLATAHCRSNVQLVMDLLVFVAQGNCLTLPGRQDSGSFTHRVTNEATLRVNFTADGRWQHCEDLKGQVLATRV
jgi:hypothetical protein